MTALQSSEGKTGLCARTTVSTFRVGVRMTQELVRPCEFSDQSVLVKLSRGAIIIEDDTEEHTEAFRRRKPDPPTAPASC